MVIQERKVRADARANRDRILDIARDALAADPHASLNSIVKAAGIGAGTFYRHFPSRDALILGLYRNDLEALAVLPPKLLAEHPPLRAFKAWCDRLADYSRIKNGIASSLHAAMSDEDFRSSYDSMVGAISHFLRSCEAAGEINPGWNADDVLFLLASLWKIPANDEGRNQTERLLALLFRGLGAISARPRTHEP